MTVTRGIESAGRCTPSRATHVGGSNCGGDTRCPLDVLVYLDVGMDSRPQMLAALRLAPVQCAALGTR